MGKGMDSQPRSNSSASRGSLRAPKSPVWIQEKLTLSKPGDAYEQEAERTAEQVMRQPVTASEAAVPQTVNLASSFFLQAQPMSDIKIENSSPAERDIPTLQGGSPLVARSRAFFENRMGWNFGDVRVHTDTQAASSAHALGARAFTIGNDIAFAQGEYRPGTPSGDRLLAHELTHVIQQSGSGSLQVQRMEADMFTEPAPDTGDKKTGLDRIKEIHSNLWIGPMDEYELEKEWSKLDPTVAEKEKDEKGNNLFSKSIEYGMEPDNLEGPHGAKIVIKEFKDTVLNVAKRYLEGNLQDIGKEETSLGIGENQPTPNQKKARELLLNNAIQANFLDHFIKELGHIVVGYKEKYNPKFEDMYQVSVYFEPDQRPEIPIPGVKDKGSTLFDETQKQYNEKHKSLMDIANKSPVIYVALKADSLETIVGKDGQPAEDPLAAIQAVFATAKQAIQETKEKKMPDWEQLKPIHAQLLDGKLTETIFPFHQLWYKEIVKDEIGDFDRNQMLIDLGIGLAAAVCFVISELATVGAATAFWAAAGGLALGTVGVGRKAINYTELKTAAATGTSEASELVAKDQVEAAKIELVIDSALLFLDAVSVVSKGIKLAKLGKEAEAARIAAKASKTAAEGAEGAGKAAVNEIDDGAKAAKAADDVADNVADDVAGNVAEDVADKVADDVADNVSDDVAETVDEVEAASKDAAKSSDEVAQNTAIKQKVKKTKKLREQYLGKTPGKASATGKKVIKRMTKEGKIKKELGGKLKFQASDGKWYPIKEADMSHKTDAVKWWNTEGRLKYRPKSKEVRQWMLDPNNYELDHYRINRSKGAKLSENYLPPLVQ